MLNISRRKFIELALGTGVASFVGFSNNEKASAITSATTNAKSSSDKPENSPEVKLSGSDNGKKIRTGIIRCDLHTTYYGTQMQEHNPKVLREATIGMGSYFYHYTQYNDLYRMTSPKVWDFEVSKIWDYDKSKAEYVSKLFFNKPKVCNTFEEVSNDVDLVFIANANSDGSDHFKLAAPGITKGVPTFIDKPFAFEVSDARKIVDLAAKHTTPIFSRSILNEVPQFTEFKNRFAEIDEPYFGDIRFAGLSMGGLIHTIAICFHLFGTGIESVDVMGDDPQVFVHISYGDKPGKPKGGVTLNCDAGPTIHSAAYASAFSHLGMITTLPGIGDFEFPWGSAKILEMTRDMIRTGKPPIPYDEMIEHIAVATAIRKSIKEKRKVFLKEV